MEYFPQLTPSFPACSFSSCFVGPSSLIKYDGYYSNEYVSATLLDLTAMHSYNILTQLKSEVQASRQYSHAKHKKELRYYSLYLKQIITIQRWFRKLMVRKTRDLESQISNQLRIRTLLRSQSDKSSAELQIAKLERAKLDSINLEELIQENKENMQNSASNMIKNVVKSADKYAVNVAIARGFMEQYREMLKEEVELQAEIRQFVFERECRANRVQQWKQKLRSIRQRIFQQNSNRKALQAQLQSKTSLASQQTSPANQQSN